MNRISEITRRDILDLFRLGIKKIVYFDLETLVYSYHGRLKEIDFLRRLYDLDRMPSLDSRYKDAEGDVWQHTINNNDYPVCWVFDDERFMLKNGSDELYLKFICEIFHPAVREEKENWKVFFDEINNLLKNDGYELYSSNKISNREVYNWRTFIPYEDGKLFIPYSLRNQEVIKKQNTKFSIKRQARKQIYKLLDKYDYEYRTTDETGWNYDTCLSIDVLNDIKQFYTPKSYNEDKEYVEAENLESIVCFGSPFHVLDVIEVFAKYNKDNDFEVQLNQLLQLNKLSIKLFKGRMESFFNIQMKSDILAPIQEAGLKELLQEASNYYENNNLKIAVEKLWDALERLKTYYSPVLDKKKSVSKIICDMSSNDNQYMKLFEDEFQQLTTIGNSFRIRHHEKTKINIEDSRHYDYFYKRCLSLISTAVQYLD